MGNFLRTSLITTLVAAPISVALNAKAGSDKDPWNNIVYGNGTLIVGGTTTGLSLVAAGALALKSSWRPHAGSAAGFGLGIGVATAAGIAALELANPED